MNCKKLVATTLTITAIAISLSACTDKTKAEDPIAIAEGSTEEKFENKNNEKDVEFMVKAAEANMKEIALGKLAQDNSKSADVKELGLMMETQHADAMNQLNALAEKKLIIIPTTISQTGKDAYDELNRKKGKDFDAAYCDMMVNGHRDAIAMFEKASAELVDTDIKAWAIATLPVLKTHLEHAIACQEKNKK